MLFSPRAGMGVFEYFQLAEALEAEPVWVINNGIAHEDQVPAAHIWPLVQVYPPPPTPPRVRPSLSLSHTAAA